MGKHHTHIYCEDPAVFQDLERLVLSKNGFENCRLKKFTEFDAEPTARGLFFISPNSLAENEFLIPAVLQTAAGKPFQLFCTVGDVNPPNLTEDLIFACLPIHYAEKQLSVVLRNGLKLLENQQQIAHLNEQLGVQTHELQELNHIGVALSAERDMGRLLNLILQKSREITRADAGTLYLVEKKKDIPADPADFFQDKQLRFKLSHCDSRATNYSEFTMPIVKSSLGGYVTLTGQVLNIPDVYRIPAECEYRHNRSFDEKVGYRTKSMLTIPMKTHKDELIGLLQLINRKREWNTRLVSPEIAEQEVIEFDSHCVELANSLASQAAVAIENNRLYDEIKSLFDGFVLAAVHAIEQRDPTTFGHSERVADLTLALAEQVNRLDTGRFRHVHLSANELQQIRYASLLHDFGKIGVRENVLVKAKKLYPHELERIIHRFHFIKSHVQLNYSDQKINKLLVESVAGIQEELQTLDSQMNTRVAELDAFLEFIIKINEPTILAQGTTGQLLSISQRQYQENGTTEAFLNEHEFTCLSIPKGSLSEAERHEIESHVNHTHNFLKRIPWTEELKAIPEIAYGHHEKLDGSGYPQGLKGESIPIQSRMMTIADIFDALTAWDRPYKKALPVDRALQILEYERKDGKIDADLFQLFIDAEIYKIVKPPQNI
jgi:HD-GYP domain-containing protein (c-di-GMP phosphodiesterase class II)